MKGVDRGAGCAAGFSLRSNGSATAESNCIDWTADKTRSCQLRKSNCASGVSLLRILRNHASDVELTNHKSICGCNDRRACSSIGPWNAASIPKVPPRQEAAKPSGKMGPSRQPLWRKRSSTGPDPKTCSQKSLMDKTKKRAWATGFSATSCSISLADGIVGHSPNKFNSYRSSAPPPCKTTIRGLRTSAKLGVRNPPEGPKANP